MVNLKLAQFSWLWAWRASRCLSSLEGGRKGGRQAGGPQGTAGPTCFTVTCEMCQALEAPHGSN